MVPSQQKKLTRQEAKLKILHFCAYQERCHKEVKEKLYTYGLYKFDVEEIISELILEGFLNEERFAKAYAGGKFRMKQWGKVKITHALESKGLTPKCVEMGLCEIDEADYQKTLRSIIEKKLKEFIDEEPFTKRNKTAAFAIQKGYEAELVWSFLKDNTKR